MTSLRNAGVTGSSPVSGTIFPKIAEKQAFKGSAHPNCSTQLSHSRAREAGLSSSNSKIIQRSQYSTALSHKRPLGLWRRGAVYQYRVRVPLDLVTVVGRTHLNRSLKTARREEALRAVRKVAFEVESEFQRARDRDVQTPALIAKCAIQQETVTLTISPKADGRTLRQAINGYMADPTRSRSLKSQAVYHVTYNAIAEILGGETPLRDIGREACRDLLSVLRNLPSNAKKRFPALTLREAAAPNVVFLRPNRLSSIRSSGPTLKLAHMRRCRVRGPSVPLFSGGVDRSSRMSQGRNRRSCRGR
ncbi:DUF6538 domain-containing protein [uncultured Novosphingobium sp.]|uniref:DUF6538 domain-containing protein n=1 Tax=uncultured Novosphingobium sp. TaxID=292277 RepID=UPI00338F355A